MTEPQPGSAKKAPPKPLFVAWYEALFNGEEASLSKANPTFWDDLFMLKINREFLERVILTKSEHDLLKMQKSFNTIFENCCNMLIDESHIRVGHALETLAVISRCLFRKRFSNFAFDIASIFCGFNNVKSFFTQLIHNVQTVIITSAGSVHGPICFSILADLVYWAHSRIQAELMQLKVLAMDFILVLITATDNISQNSFVEYLMTADMFDTLLQEVESFSKMPEPTEYSTLSVAFQALVSIVFLCQYQKYEAKNAFLQQIASVNSDHILGCVYTCQHRFARHLLDSFAKTLESKGVKNLHLLDTFRAAPAPSTQVPHAGEPIAPLPKSGLLSSISGIISSLWAGSNPPAVNNHAMLPGNGLVPPTTCAFLLTLYQWAAENSQYQSAMWWKLENKPNCQGSAAIASPQQPSKASSLDIGFAGSSLVQRTTLQIPSLLVDLLRITTFLLADLKDVKTQASLRLALLTWQLLVESPEINGYMRDPRISVHVPLIYIAGRFDNLSGGSTLKSTSGSGRTSPKFASTPIESPISCALINLLALFLRKNLKRDFNVELYGKALDILHRMLCYDKKMRIRLPVPWRPVWRAMAQLLLPLSQKDSYNQSGSPLLVLASKAVRIWNMFITFGDSFLPQLSDYDELYYELLLAEKEWRAFIETMNEVDKTGNVVKDLWNVQSILDHFSAKIEQWFSNHPGGVISPEQVVAIIRDNYSTLQLKLHTSLDRFEPYVENPKESVYFRHLLRTLMFEWKNSMVVHSLDPQRSESHASPVKK